MIASGGLRAMSTSDVIFVAAAIVIIVLFLIGFQRAMRDKREE